MGSQVTVIEDDDAVAQVLEMQLSQAGFGVRRYADGEAALREVARFRADVIVLDLRLPGADGFTVLQRVRAERDVPVLVLTAMGDGTSKARAFDLGADDYVVKPFDVEEVLARIRALLRRSGRPGGPPTVCGGLWVCAFPPAVTVCGTAVGLSQRGIDLLYALSQSPNRALTRGQLIDRAWGGATAVDARLVDAYITRIRGKLAEAWGRREGEPPWCIQTVWGVGYKFTCSGPADTL